MPEAKSENRIVIPMNNTTLELVEGDAEALRRVQPRVGGPKTDADAKAVERRSTR